MISGLKVVGTQCNYTVSEIADFLNVNVETVRKWISLMQDIPDPYLDQLSVLFGIEKEYLGSISEERKEEILGRAMFQISNSCKYTFEIPIDKGNATVYFMQERNITMQEEVEELKQKLHRLFDSEHEEWNDCLSQIADLNRQISLISKIEELYCLCMEAKPTVKMKRYTAVKQGLDDLQKKISDIDETVKIDSSYEKPACEYGMLSHLSDLENVGETLTFSEKIHLAEKLYQRYGGVTGCGLISFTM